MKVVYSLLLLCQLGNAQSTPFTSTQELYLAVDDYFAGGGANNTNSSLKYGYPIGTWDVSQLTNFSAVFDPDRDSLFEDFSIEIRSMPYDVSGWDVSNAVDMSRMFRATTFNGDLAVSISLVCCFIRIFFGSFSLTDAFVSSFFRCGALNFTMLKT